MSASWKSFQSLPSTAAAAATTAATAATAAAAAAGSAVQWDAKKLAQQKLGPVQCSKNLITNLIKKLLPKKDM